MDTKQQHPRTPTPTRRPYEAPRVDSDEVLERAALACSSDIAFPQEDKQLQGGCTGSLVS